MRVVKRLLLAAAVLALVFPPAPAQAQAPQQAQGTIFDFGFVLPARLEVGTTLTMTNTGARPHTFTDRGGAFDSDAITPAGTGEVTFTVPGTYAVFCRINPGRMNGTVVVEPGPGVTPVQRIQALDPAREGETLRYDPPTLTIQTGSAVLFANVGGSPHTLTADDGSFDTGIVMPGPENGRFAGSNASLILRQPGTFAFHCEIHPQAMRGTLTVAGEPAAQAPPPVAAPAPQPAQAPPAAATAEVGIADFQFSPVESSVAPGAQVTWRSTGQAPHTATFDDVQLDTGQITPGGAATLTAPTEPGSYSYFCAIHPDRMRAVLVVVGEGIADPTGRAAPPAGVPAGQAAPTGQAQAPAPPPPTGGRGTLTLVLVTVVVGAFLGGFGLSAFLKRRTPPSS